MAEPETPLRIPISVDAIEPHLRRFCDGPLPARSMAAKGIAPIKGADLLTVLACLAGDAEASVRDAATQTLRAMPAHVILGLISTVRMPEVIDWVVRNSPVEHTLWLETIALPQTHAETLVWLAQRGDDALTERIAVNEQRLLQAPQIIEALYHNPATRMSTVDRLIDLAVRNHVELKGVASFQAHAEAIKGQLILEPDVDPLPEDHVFSDTHHQAKVLSGQIDGDVVERNPVDGAEVLKAKLEPLSTKIGKMNLASKIRLATIGSGAARSILVRDNNRLVSLAAVSSPLTTDADATTFAHSKELSSEVLRYIGSRRDWLHNYELKRALVMNPKTPQGTALQFIGHLRDNDIKSMARSRNVPAPIKSAAIQLMRKKEEKERK